MSKIDLSEETKDMMIEHKSRMKWVVIINIIAWIVIITNIMYKKL